MPDKFWFQRELERVTVEHWYVTVRQSDVSVSCSHGMRISVPFPSGFDRPFLNDAAERRFVGQVLIQHRPWADMARHYTSPAWSMDMG